MSATFRSTIQVALGLALVALPLNGAMAPSEAVAATTITLQPGEADSSDVFVYQFLPTSNWNAAPPFSMILAASHTGDSSAHHTQSLIAFDVASTGLTGDQIGDAVVELFSIDGSVVGFPFANPTTTDPVTLDLFAASAASDESTVTWNTKPAPLGGAVDTVELDGIGKWISFDVTDLVRDWLDGVLDNNGLLLTQRDEVRISGVAAAGVFNSASAAFNRPRLVITAVPEPSAVVLLLAACPAALWWAARRRQRGAGR